MTVLERAIQRLNEEVAIDWNSNLVTYWAAYIDGVKAQLEEDNNKKEEK